MQDRGLGAGKWGARGTRGGTGRLDLVSRASGSLRRLWGVVCIR